MYHLLNFKNNINDKTCYYKIYHQLKMKKM